MLDFVAWYFLKEGSIAHRFALLFTIGLGGFPLCSLVPCCASTFSVTMSSTTWHTSMSRAIPRTRAQPLRGRDPRSPNSGGRLQNLSGWKSMTPSNYQTLLSCSCKKSKTISTTRSRGRNYSNNRAKPEGLISGGLFFYALQVSA